MSESDRYLLTEIVKGEQQNNAPRITVNKYFEFFSAEQILKKREFDLDPEEVWSGVHGGADDGGVDAIYLFFNRRLIREDDNTNPILDQQAEIELIIIQSKFRDSFSEEAVLKLMDFTEHCLRLEPISPTVNKLYNDEIINSILHFKNIYKSVLTKRPTLSIKYFYSSIGDHVHNKVQTRADLLISRCKELYPAAQVNFEFILSSELIALFNRVPTKTIVLKTYKIMISSSFGTAYVCLVRLNDFYEFITENGKLRNHVFESNVRAYQGDVTVNEEIAETLLRNTTEEFWWLNNGITIIGSKATGAGENIAITDPMIVNGLQTSNKIYNHFSEKKAQDERTILVRVIESINPQTIDKIIKATNSQTKVNKIYLHATERVHRNIEQALKTVDLYYDRRKNYYRRLGKPTSKIITLPFLAQTVAAILLQKPDDSRARPTTVADRHYKSLFSENHPIGLYIKAAQLINRVNDFLDGQELTRTEKNDLRFYVAMYTTCVALRKAKPKPTEIADLVIADINDDLIDECFDEIQGIYQKHGANDRTAKGPHMVTWLLKRLDERFVEPLRVKRK